MKTTVEIADDLAKAAKQHAARHNITFRSLIERGLRMAIRADSGLGEFRLRDASVPGKGLQEQYRGADWVKIRDSVYEERGKLGEFRAIVKSGVRQVGHAVSLLFSLITCSPSLNRTPSMTRPSCRKPRGRFQDRSALIPIL